MPLIFLDKIAPEMRAAFGQKVIRISEKLLINPNWLMQVMYAESRLNPQAKNSQKNHLIAVGLLQFTRGAGIQKWGHDLYSIYRLNALEQLDLVERYFSPYAGKMHSYYEVYLVTFFPAAIGKSDDYVFHTSQLSAGVIAKQNPAVNINKDGFITLAEFKQYVRNSVPPAVAQWVFGTGAIVKEAVATLQETVQENPHTTAIGGALLTLAAFFTSLI